LRTGLDRNYSLSDRECFFLFVYPEVHIPQLLTENVSIVISNLGRKVLLSSLGSPEDVGNQLIQNFIAPPGSDKKAVLVSSEALMDGTKEVYHLELDVSGPSWRRRSVSAITIMGSTLYTFTVQIPVRAWQNKQQDAWQMVRSFHLI